MKFIYQKKNSLNALNGDRVLIEIVEESNKIKKKQKEKL